jgi:hypothetical protein
VYRIARRPVPEHRAPDEVAIAPRAKALTFRTAGAAEEHEAADGK